MVVLEVKKDHSGNETRKRNKNKKIELMTVFWINDGI